MSRFSAIHWTGFAAAWDTDRLETTFKYLHTLNELAMETRLALVPDEWAEFGFSAGELVREVADELPTAMTADSA